MSIEWQVSQMLLSHPVHGRFTVSFYNDAERPAATALRTHSVGKRLQNEWIGGMHDGLAFQFGSIEAAQAAVAAHIALLDAGVPDWCSVATEQLEACRPLEASCR